jgi:flavoprotein
MSYPDLDNPPPPTYWTCTNADCPEHGVVKEGTAALDADVRCGACGQACSGQAGGDE